MCGIVGVVQGDPGRSPPALGDAVRVLESAQLQLGTGPARDGLVHRLRGCAERIEEANGLLRGVPGILCLTGDPSAIQLLGTQLDSMWAEVERLDAALDSADVGTTPGDVEDVNAALVRVKDALWAVRRDRLRTAEATLDLAGRDATPQALAAFAQIEIALAAIDRLEVRGRDSAGLAVFVRGHSLDPATPSVRELWSQRSSDPFFRSMSVHSSNGCLCFAYKAAAEIGELGDNTRTIRHSVRSDPLLHLAVGSEGSRALVLGHTRWASVGMISESNAHPVSSEEEGRDNPFVVAALNGDVDNYADLRVSEDITAPLEITTDAKVIPVLTGRRLADGLPPEEAFRQTAVSLQGSVAVAAVAASCPDRLLLALRGSGQALYVGFAEDAYVVASEPYGLVEQATSYLRMDGETLAGSDDPSTQGQIVVLEEAGAGTISGVRRMSYGGADLPVDPGELQRPEITTRDVDRGSYSHFLLKEISEAPRSFRKTLRGRLVSRHGADRVSLGPETLPDSLRARLQDGQIRRIMVVGQGTAAVAGRALASAVASALRGTAVTVEALTATELSGFGLHDDMSDSLVVAISQSGTTTDTNRTVEVVRARGAWVVAVVNRRQSDLTDRAHGVLYTSDGRDVEMAVPSTKAFYSQIAAGFLLAAAIGDEVPAAPGVDPSVLRALRKLPAALEEILEMREEIAEIARRHAPGRRDWAIVGNGFNRVAAEEIRIKLSELCYKSISCDVTEDKKHIDLSAEPLILVCAAGLDGSNAADVAKEVAIYRAHKAAPIVICGEGEGLFDSALDVIRVPSVHPEVAFVLSAMAGHIFGYEAALAIDAQALPLREARAAIEAAAEVRSANGRDPVRLLDRLRPALAPIAGRFLEGLRTGGYDGHLEASTAVRVASLFRYATGVASLDGYQVEHGKIGTPDEVIEDLTDALTAGIDELTRPIDAIRHQAKTVTVGISRADETLLRFTLVREVLSAGAARDRLSYGVLRVLAALDPAVARVTGYTHYTIDGDVDGEALIRVTDRGGIARDIPSRTERDPRLRGTKHRVATEREVLVTRGHDGRTLVIVPETKGTEVGGIALLHVRFHERLSAHVMRGVLQGYRDRYAALSDLVTETEPSFRDDLLEEIAVEDLLINSIQALAERWRTGVEGEGAPSDSPDQRA